MVQIRAANTITTIRLLLACVVALLVVLSFSGPARVGLLVTLAAIALVLDGVDGYVARRTGTCTRFGARYDMEVDAFLVLVLSTYVAAHVAWWVLLIGLARYLLLVAGWCWPWLRGETPPRYWAKVTAAVQGIVLTVVAADLLPRAVELTALVVALALLVESFAHQVRQLWGTRPAQAHGRPALAVTVAAYVVVWLALVAPDRLDQVSLGAVLRVPVELLVLVAVALVTPRAARRPVSALVGVLLTLLLVLRALDLGFSVVLDRPFDLLNDSYYLGPAIGVVRDSGGLLGAAGVVAAVVLLVVVLLAVLTGASARVMSSAARHRRFGVSAVAGIAAVGVLTAAAGSGLASTRTTDLALGQVRAVRSDLADRTHFAHELAAPDVVPSGLLTGLRGKDVLLVFVESYGRVAVQGTSYSPGIDAVLERGTAQLQASGYGARSAFLTSPTFGAASWLAHSTLESGLWVDSQQRYNQLVTARRTTLTSAFEQSGWRTVFDVPAITKNWADGRRFYGFDKLYDADNVDYRGPRFGYATMPDQFTLAALQRNELTGAHQPVMAEVDLVSSHHPWTPLPHLVGWPSVGDGSVFDHVPTDGGSAASVLADPTKVRAAYGESVEYTWQALVSWLGQVSDPNLVLVVLGDHQPHSYVSGTDPGHDVPISIIARDPAVLSAIDGWHWQDGLLPAPDASVWRMDTFRNRFLAAFSGEATERRHP
ncbi:CDP-alcohol phosphatidyltransferase family protein [Nocardioides sp. Iso805N]|uniref:CDP-alcohol phosphatidyltransferase family protein n=1 Tax=Nocardioides sp. Iso805N TaxID=1283287 RepID=UPI0003A0381D|nr:CDP-alcohol phosphatidyltransferase family protein [Nocardioides sp. Iso805N]